VNVNLVPLHLVQTLVRHQNHLLLAQLQKVAVLQGVNAAAAAAAATKVAKAINLLLVQEEDQDNIMLLR
jgi:hypothetical protein